MKKRNGDNLRLSVRVAIAGTLLGAALPVAAQDSSGAKSIEEVIVTAQRREEGLQTVPLSITALDAEVLKNNNATSLNDIIYLVPNLSFSETGYGSDAIIANIRGQGVFGGRNPAVGMYLNEVPVPQVGPTAPGAYVGGKGLFFDLANVQVVKGPQGTLFGRNTTGGAFLLETRRPGEEFGCNLEIGYGNYGNTEVNGGIDIPIVEDKLLARVAVSYQRRDGYVDVAASPSHPEGTDAHDVDSTGVRATLTWRPTETIENELVLSDFRSRTNGTQLIFTELLPNSFVPSFFPQAGSIAEQQRTLGIRDAVPQSLDTQYDVDLSSAINITSIELTDNLILRNILGYTEQKIASARSFDGSGLTLFHRFSIGDQPTREQLTEEIQLQGTAFDDRITWTLGYFYLDLPDNGFEANGTRAFGGPRRILAVDYSEESSAFYGQGTYALTDDLKLTVGYRHTKDEASGTQRTLNGDFQCVAPNVPPYDATCSVTLSEEWTADTWNVALDYQLTESTMVYGAVRRGFRSGGFNFISATRPDTLSYDPEEVTDYEIGIKSDWELGTMPVRTNVAFFYDEFTDAQATRSLPEEADLVLAIDNAAEAEIEGMELEVMMQPTDNLQLSFYGSYLDFEFTKFAAGTRPEDIIDIRESERYGRPRYTYGVSASYTVPLGDPGELDLYANYSYSDKMYTDQFNERTKFDAHGLLNINVGWNNVMGLPYDVSFFMNNALDETYRTYVIAEASLGYAGYEYGAPRMYGVRVNYRFGSEEAY